MYENLIRKFNGSIVFLHLNYAGLNDLPNLQNINFDFLLTTQQF